MQLSSDTMPTCSLTMPHCPSGMQEGKVLQVCAFEALGIKDSPYGPKAEQRAEPGRHFR